MRIFNVEIEYSLFLNNSFTTSIRRDIGIGGPCSIDIDSEQGYATILNTQAAAIDNKHDIEYPQSVSISTKKVPPRSFVGFLKMLHANERNYDDKDADIVIFMHFSQHQGFESHPAYFSDNAIVHMLDIPQEDIITLGYNGNSIHYILFVMRDNHKTKGLLGGEECLCNELGKLKRAKIS